MANFERTTNSFNIAQPKSSSSQSVLNNPKIVTPPTMDMTTQIDSDANLTKPSLPSDQLNQVKSYLKTSFSIQSSFFIFGKLGNKTLIVSSS